MSESMMLCVDYFNSERKREWKGKKRLKDGSKKEGNELLSYNKGRDGRGFE